jgi:hypothetical protein
MKIRSAGLELLVTGNDVTTEGNCHISKVWTSVTLVLPTAGDLKYKFEAASMDGTKPNWGTSSNAKSLLGCSRAVLRCCCNECAQVYTVWILRYVQITLDRARAAVNADGFMSPSPSSAIIWRHGLERFAIVPVELSVHTGQQSPRASAVRVGH